MFFTDKAKKYLALRCGLLHWCIIVHWINSSIRLLAVEWFPSWLLYILCEPLFWYFSDDCGSHVISFDVYIF